MPWEVTLHILCDEAPQVSSYCVPTHFISVSPYRMLWSRTQGCSLVTTSLTHTTLLGSMSGRYEWSSVTCATIHTCAHKCTCRHIYTSVFACTLCVLLKLLCVCCLNYSLVWDTYIASVNDSQLKASHSRVLCERHDSNSIASCLWHWELQLLPEAKWVGGKEVGGRPCMAD